jgi:hypothetical protein
MEMSIKLGALAPLPPGEESPVSVGYLAGWVLKPVWIWGEIKNPSACREWSSDRPASSHFADWGYHGLGRRLWGSGHIYPQRERERTTGTHWMGILLRSNAIIDLLLKGNISKALCKNRSLGPSALNHSVNYDTTHVWKSPRPELILVWIFLCLPSVKWRIRDDQD